MMKKIILFSLLLFGAFSSVLLKGAWGATFDPANKFILYNPSSAAQGFQTFASAHATALNGATIEINITGNPTELQILENLVITKNITLDGKNTTKYTFKGVSYVTSPVILIQNATVTLKNIHTVINTGYYTPTNDIRIKQDSGSVTSVNITNCIIGDDSQTTDIGIYVGGCSTLNISNSQIKYHKKNGIQILSAGVLTFCGNTLSYNGQSGADNDYSTYGLNIGTVSTGSSIYNNLFISNGLSGTSKELAYTGSTLLTEYSNWWGTTDGTQLKTAIYDKNSKLVHSTILSAASLGSSLLDFYPYYIVTAGYLTFTDAQNAVSLNGTITVTENRTVSESIVITKNLILVGKNSSIPTSSIIKVNSGTAVIYISGSTVTSVSIKNLSVMNTNVAGLDGIYVDSSSLSQLLVENVVITNNSSGIHVSSLIQDLTLTISSCNIHDNTLYGILTDYLYRTSDVLSLTVRDSIIASNSYSGIAINHQGNFYGDHNLIQNNAISGIVILSMASISSSNIYHNTIKDNGPTNQRIAIQYYSENGSRGILQAKNNYWGTTSTTVLESILPSANCVVYDPYLTYDPLSTLENVTLKDGSWTDASVWSLNQLPAYNMMLTIKHQVYIPTNNISAVALGCTIEKDASLTFFAATKLILSGDLSVSGLLALYNGSILEFSDSSITRNLTISSNGKLILYGTADQPIQIKGSTTYYLNFDISGSLKASHFICLYTNGLLLRQSAKIIHLSHGKIVHIPSQQAHIVSEKSFKAEYIEFDEIFHTSGRYNVQIPEDQVAWLINCTQNNSLTDSSTRVLWRSSEATNTAMDYALEDLGGVTSVSAGDINSDGLPDLFVCRISTGDVSAGTLYLNTGTQNRFTDITTQSAIAITASQNVIQATFFDYNNDGYEDLLLLFSDGTIQLWKNEWNGSLSNAVTFSNVSSIITSLTSLPIKCFTYIDLNHDYLMDLVLVSNSSIKTLIQTSQHIFEDKTSDYSQKISFPSTATTPLGCYAYDLDNNGLNDLIILYSNYLEIHYVNSDQTITKVQYSKAEGIDILQLPGLSVTPFSMSFGDLNQDGYLDFIISSQGNHFAVFMNNNKTKPLVKDGFIIKPISHASPPSYQTVYQSVLFDKNHDGLLDILQASNEALSQVAVTALQQGESTFAYDLNSTSLPIHTMAARGILVADINRDRIPDKYVASFLQGNELYLTPREANWLTVKLKGESNQESRLMGARIVVEADSYSQTQQVNLTDGYFSQPFTERYFDLGTRSTISKLTVIFPSGKIYTQSNISVYPTASILVDESNCRSYWTLSGTLTTVTGTSLSPVKIEVIDCTTLEVTKNFYATNGTYSVTLNSFVKSIKLRATYDKSSTKSISLETSEITLTDDKVMNFQFPGTPYTFTGSVLYQNTNVPLQDILVKAIRVEADSQGTQNTCTALTNESGLYSLELAAGEWHLFYYKDTQYLAQSSTYNVPNVLTVSPVYITVEDSSPSSVYVSNLADGQTISGNVSILGSITDDVGVAGYKVSYAVANSSSWTVIYEKQGKPDAGLIAQWNTIDLSDGSYQIKVSAVDAANKATNVIIQNLIVQNILPELYQKSLPEGLYFLSSPFYVTQTFSHYHTPTKIARYNPLLSSYQLASNLSETSFVSGYAYWFQIDAGQSVLLDLTGAKANYQSVTVNVDEGWNMIGNPFHYAISLSTLQFKVGDQTLTMDQAIANGVVVRTFWNWVDHDYSAITSTSTLSPWSGIWMRVTKSAALIIPKITTQTTASIKSAGVLNEFRTQSASADNWSLRFILKDQNGILDGNTIIGVAKSAVDDLDNNDIPKPPPFMSTNFSYARMYFPSKSSQKDDYAFDIRSKIQDTKTWEVLVDATSYQEKTLTIELDCLTKLPEKYAVRLFDQTNQQWSDIQHSKMYTFSVKNQAIYPFSIVVEDTSKTLENVLFAISNVKIYPNPFNPNSSSDKQNKVRIMYELSKSATGKLNIYAVSGRLVKSFDITSDQYGLRQTNTILWDGKDEMGTLLPNDVYFFLLTLKDDESHDCKAKGKIVLWKK